MNPTSDGITSGVSARPDSAPAYGGGNSAETQTPEDVEVAFGDDAEGAVGSGAPVESTGRGAGGD